MFGEDEGNLEDLFREPEDFYRSRSAPTNKVYKLRTGRELKLRLVGQNPLWGHHLWQAAIVVSRYLEQHSDEYLRDKAVLELGAGGGLPSLLAAVSGAKLAVVTDYPDNDLIENLQFNIDNSLSSESERARIVTCGFLWGSEPEPLLRLLSQHPGSTAKERFDTLILADLLFNHTCHEALVNTISQTLSSHTRASALVFFSPYRPWLFEKDMAFFELVRQHGSLVVEELGQWMMDQVMFKDDRGDERLRRTVFGFRVSWRAT